MLPFGDGEHTMSTAQTHWKSCAPHMTLLCSCFPDATGTGTRRNRVFAIAEDNSGGDLADRNMRKRDRIARVEVALSLCMIADRRRHERECGPCSENRCLSGARTKHHLRSVPWEDANPIFVRQPSPGS